MSEYDLLNDLYITTLLRNYDDTHELRSLEESRNLRWRRLNAANKLILGVMREKKESYLGTLLEQFARLLRNSILLIDLFSVAEHRLFIEFTYRTALKIQAPEDTQNNRVHEHLMKQLCALAQYKMSSRQSCSIQYKVFGTTASAVGLAAVGLGIYFTLSIATMGGGFAITGAALAMVAAVWVALKVMEYVAKLVKEHSREMTNRQQYRSFDETRKQMSQQNPSQPLSLFFSLPGRSAVVAKEQVDIAVTIADVPARSPAVV